VSFGPKRIVRPKRIVMPMRSMFCRQKAHPAGISQRAPTPTQAGPRAPVVRIRDLSDAVLISCIWTMRR
jgi:hypothetical protein